MSDLIGATAYSYLRPSVLDGHYNLTHFGYSSDSHFNEVNERSRDRVYMGAFSDRRKSAAYIRGAGLSRGTYDPRHHIQQCLIF